MRRASGQTELLRPALGEKKCALHGVFAHVVAWADLASGAIVPYDHVDPKAARELFIRHALVDGDYHSNAPFYVVNRKLLEEVGMIQHKGRRVDLVEDEEWLYAFYDHKLPPEIVSGVTLDTWRKKWSVKISSFCF